MGANVALYRDPTAGSRLVFSAGDEVLQPDSNPINSSEAKLSLMMLTKRSATGASRRGPPNGDWAERLVPIRCMVWLGLVIRHSLVSTEAQ